jgi:hypothetical protein
LVEQFSQNLYSLKLTALLTYFILFSFRIKHIWELK